MSLVVGVLVLPIAPCWLQAARWAAELPRRAVNVLLIFRDAWNAAASSPELALPVAPRVPGPARWSKHA